MNLAIEYMIRSEEFKHMLEFPYSLFITSYASNAKTVVTIHKSFQSVSPHLTVKHWHIHECKADEKVPQFAEYEVPCEEMFVSEKVVVPGHYPIWYREQPYVAGKTQHSDMPQAAEDEKEYSTTLNTFLNSAKHREARVEWLWRAFASVYDVEMKGLMSLENGGHHMGILKRFYPHLASSWVKWRRYMLDYSTKIGQVAGELLFHREYAEMAKKEGRPVADTNHEEVRRSAKSHTNHSNYHLFTIPPYQTWSASLAVLDQFASYAVPVYTVSNSSVPLLHPGGLYRG